MIAWVHRWTITAQLPISTGLVLLQLLPLQLLLQPVDQFLQSLPSMRDLVLLRLGHLGVRLAFILKACVPA